jgi:hypothetical protein
VRWIHDFGWKLEGKNNLKDPGIDGKAVLKWILSVGVCELDASGLGLMVDFSAHNSKPLGFIKGKEFLG